MTQPTVKLTRDQAVVLLTDGERGVAEWNEHCRVGHGTSDLSRVVLHAAQLSGANLASADLTDARLMSANLSHANLIGADLTEADLRETDLSEASLIGASLIQANLNRAKLVQSKLTKAKLSYASLIQADLASSDLTEASLNRAHLSEANLDQTCLIQAKLGGAELTGANLRRANLSGADLSGADLRGADLTGANLEHANLEDAEFQDARLVECRLNGARLARNDLDEDVDLMLMEWDTLMVDGTSYRRDAVETGAQKLPGWRPPLRVSFSLGDEITGADLAALKRLVQTGGLPKGTGIFLAFTTEGIELVLEGRGKLEQAALLAAVLFALPVFQDGVTGLAARNGLEQSLTGSPELLACAKKLDRVSVRPRARAEFERFQSLLRHYGADDAAVVTNQVVTLVRRTPEAERALLDALGFSDLSRQTHGTSNAEQQLADPIHS